MIQAQEGVQRLTLRDPSGAIQLSRRLPAPVPELSLDLPWRVSGTWTAELDGPGGPERQSFDVPASLPAMVVRIDAPIGQGERQVLAGEVLTVPVLPGRPTELSIQVRALRPGPVRIILGEEELGKTLEAGERLSMRASLGEERSLRVEAGGERLEASLRPERLPIDRLREELRIVELRFPADSNGEADISRPTDRFTLPARWWTQGLRALSLGVRARDPWAPWAHLGVLVANEGDEARNIVLRLRLEDPAGDTVAALAPRARDGLAEGGAVQVLLRVPPRTRSLASIPVYADEGALQGIDLDRAVARVELQALGLPEVLTAEQRELYIDRGNAWVSLGLLGSVLAAISGSAMLLARSRSWLTRARTSELLTIALFSSLSFIVGLVGRLLTMAVSTLLGPFAILVSGLVDDVLRTALLATLLSLLPRPGTLALFVVTSWLLSGLALGSFTPSDLIFVGARVFWLEGLAWLVGLSRGAAWLEQGHLVRFLRLSTVLGGASVLTSAIGMVLSVTLYRLHLAGWYVGLMLALPGFLYVLAGVALSLPFSDSLRRVRR